MKLYFVRHGNTFHNTDIPRQVGCKTDLPLTEKGIAQIHRLKEHFRIHNNNFDICYCGPLKRQVQSSEILIDKNKIKIMPELNEIDYGVWENLTSSQIKEKWPDAYMKWHKQAIWPDKIFCGDESEHIHNLSKVIKNISSNNNENVNILVVSSQGLIRYLLYLYGNWQSIVDNNKMEDYKIKPSNYCTLEIKQGLFNIINWNNSSNLVQS